MLSDRELAAYADPALGQHFLVSPDKLSQMIGAAGIRPTDRVVEVGAGVGTVARVLPPCLSLTVVELDERLTGFLQLNAPTATVLQGDALELIQRIPCDILIGNLPHIVTEGLLDLVPCLSFRTAVLTVGEHTLLDRLGPRFTWSEVTRITDDDFVPPQPSVSRVMRIARATPSV